MVPGADTDEARIAELSAIVQAVRDRVRARYPAPADAETAADPLTIRARTANLMPIVHARDAAQAKFAAIGSVNPRAGGPMNAIIQTFKKTIARSLQWFVRDQVIFNRETISAVEAVLEALNDQNRALAGLAGQASEAVANVAGRIEHLLRQNRDQTRELNGQTRELKDLGQHWIAWRTEWERKLSVNEIQFLRTTADLQGAFQHRVTLMESNFREIVQAQHRDYLGAIDRATVDIQKRLWKDLQNMRAEYDRLIHDELRVIRVRASRPVAEAVAGPPVAPPAAAEAVQPSLSSLDYTRFAYRFRGTEESIRRNLEAYKPFFAECRDVLDIGCGRGEFLELMRGLGVKARGIDLGEEAVAQCRGKGLDAEVADLFPYLAGLPAGEFDGIFSSQVVEHLDPARLPEMIRLCAASLRRGGVLAIETPNPECLAIFATYFYLDPTHTRPVPHPLLAFYMEEYGLGGVEVLKLAPAVESWPEIGELPEAFRERFFGGLDYAIVGRRL